MSKKLSIMLILILMTFPLCYAQTIPGRSLHQLKLVALKNQQTNNFIFYTLIAKRCQRYMAPSDAFSCKEAVAEMIDLLDTDLLLPNSSINPESSIEGPKAFLFVAFKNNLIEQLSAPETTAYLKQLQIELNKYLTRETEEFNLWNNTLKFFHSTEKSAQVIATLFQDTSQSMLHVNYLERARIEGKHNFKQNKESLRATIEILNMVLEYQENNHLKLLYPADMKESLNKNLYHFYVPYYLSMALEKSSVNKSMAYVAPMLMTLTYEFITASSDYRYVYKDPETLDPSQHGWKIKDILAGHLGASRGSRKKNIKTLMFLNGSFAQSTEKTVKALLAP